MGLELGLLLVLFCLSAFFSASETALFSLRRHDREWLEQYLVNQARLNRNRYYGPQRIGYY